MTLSNIRFSNSNNIVANHNYNETQSGGFGRKVEKVKVIAKQAEGKVYRFVSTSKKGRELASEFAQKNNITIK